MKALFQTVLYFNVGIGGLFFGIWLISSSLFSSPSAVAETATETATEAPLPTENANALPAESVPENNLPAEGALPAEAQRNVNSVPQPNAGEANAQLPQAGEAPVGGVALGAEPNAGDPSALPATEGGVLPDGNIPADPALQGANNEPLPTEGDPILQEANALQGENNVAPLPTEGDPVAGEGTTPLEETSPTRDIANFSNKKVPQPPDSTDVVTQKDKKEGKSDNAEDDLQNINKRLVEIYSMLKAYKYDPSQRKDPFDPWQPKKKVVEKVDTKEEEVVIPTDHPTGEYNIKELTLVGIKWGSRSGPPKALFKTPDNVLHNMQEKDRIGNNRGVIYKMREDEVVILEPNQGVIEEGEEAYSPIIVRLDRVKKKDKNL